MTQKQTMPLVALQKTMLVFCLVHVWINNIATFINVLGISWYPLCTYVYTLQGTKVVFII